MYIVYNSDISYSIKMGVIFGVRFERRIFDNNSKPT